MKTYELSNKALNFEAQAQDGCVHMKLATVADGLVWSDAPYVYRLTRATEDGTVTHELLRDVRIETGDHSIVVRGTLEGLEIEHRFRLPPDRAYMEEQLTLRHSEDQPVCLLELETGFQQQVSTEIGWIPGERQSERLVAVPFRIRASDGPGHVNDYTLDQLLKRVGGEHRVNSELGIGAVPSRHHLSEGWAWTRGERTLGVFKFSQETMEWSALTPIVREDGVWLRFGGVCLTGGEPAVLTRLAPKQPVALGVTRYHPVAGDYRAACAAFRDMLDERGCRFPADYQPPVHWNELYDSPDWNVQSAGTPGDTRNSTRHRLYTRAAMEIEAAKARDYHCEALYLDPGWDTLFGSFLWNEAALGPRRQFVNELRTRPGALLLQPRLQCAGLPAH